MMTTLRTVVVVSWLRLLPLCLYITAAAVNADIVDKPKSAVALRGSEVTFTCGTNSLQGNIRWSVYDASTGGDEIVVYVNQKIKVNTTKMNLTMYAVNLLNVSSQNDGVSPKPVRRYDLSIKVVQNSDAGLFFCYESSKPSGRLEYAYLTVFDGQPQCTTDLTVSQGEYQLKQGQMFVINCTLRYVGNWVPGVRCRVADVDVVLKVIGSTHQQTVYGEQLSIVPTSSAGDKLTINCEFYVNATADKAKECHRPNCDFGLAILHRPWTSPLIRYVPSSRVATSPPADSASTVAVDIQAGKATAITVSPRLTDTVDSSGDSSEKRHDGFPSTGVALIAVVVVLIVVASIVAILLVTLLFHFKRRQNASIEENNRRFTSTPHQPTSRTDSNLLSSTVAISTMSSASQARSVHHYAELLDPVLPTYAANSGNVTFHDEAAGSSSYLNPLPSSNQLIVFDASSIRHKKPASDPKEGTAAGVIYLGVKENQPDMGLSGVTVNRGDVQPVFLCRRSVVRVPDVGGIVLVGENPSTLSMPPIPDNDESIYLDGGTYEMVQSPVPIEYQHSWRKSPSTYSTLTSPPDEGVSGRDNVRFCIPPPGGDDETGSQSQPAATIPSLEMYTDIESVMNSQQSNV